MSGKTSFFVLNRRGHFQPPFHTPNQCAQPDWPRFSYWLKLVFDGDQKLDASQFITDHVNIDQFVNELELVGSCEEMQKRIEKKLPEWCASKQLKLAAFKCTIYPKVPPGEAYLEFVWGRSEKDMKCLSYL
jgi:hypothetical protein